MMMWIWRMKLLMSLVLVPTLINARNSTKRSNDYLRNDIELFQSDSKIAFLFLLRDNFPFEWIWYEFFHWKVELTDKSFLPYSIYLHMNHPLPKTSFFSGREIVHSVATSWGSISLVQAIQQLLKEALLDPKNQIFCLLSDSCIPLQPFPVFQTLLSHPKSIIRACSGNQGFGIENHQRWYPRLSQSHDPILLQQHYWRKSEMYFSLIRKHAQLLSQISLLDWDKVFAPDEHVFPTMLAAAHLEHETTCSKGFTSITWSLEDLAHPHTFQPHELNASLFHRLKNSAKGNSPCSGRPHICHFTARKFAASTQFPILYHYLPVLFSTTSHYPRLIRYSRTHLLTSTIWKAILRDYCYVNTNDTLLFPSQPAIEIYFSNHTLFHHISNQSLQQYLQCNDSHFFNQLIHLHLLPCQAVQVNNKNL